MDGGEELIKPSEENIRKRFDTLVKLYEEQFCLGIEEKYQKDIYLSKELLHCAVTAYFDDIYKYKAYSGAIYADRHKQAAYTIIWISRFHPIQIKQEAKVSTKLLTINETFALFAGFMFLDPVVISKLNEPFYRHLIYTLVYRELPAKGWATLIYLMETGAKQGVRF